MTAVALELRDPELTDRVLTRQPERTDNRCLDATNRMLRASVATAAGDFGQALDHILQCGRQLDRAGWLNPVLFPWQTAPHQLVPQIGHPPPDRTRRRAGQYPCAGLRNAGARLSVLRRRQAVTASTSRSPIE